MSFAINDTCEPASIPESFVVDSNTNCENIPVELSNHLTDEDDNTDEDDCEYYEGCFYNYNTKTINFENNLKIISIEKCRYEQRRESARIGYSISLADDDDILYDFNILIDEEGQCCEEVDVNSTLILTNNIRYIRISKKSEDSFNSSLTSLICSFINCNGENVGEVMVSNRHNGYYPHNGYVILDDNVIHRESF